ncbi:MAG: hypothetical protein R3C32_10645 [Chloroflexota bacterium]
MTDVSNASRTSLLDIRRLDWDPWLCATFDVPMGAAATHREFERPGRRDRPGPVRPRHPHRGHR